MILNSKEFVVLLAGGKGTRMNKELPKQFLHLSDKPVICYSVESFLNYNPKIYFVFVVLPEYKHYLEELLRKFFPDLIYSIVLGGRTRTESSWNAMKFLHYHFGEKMSPTDLIAIHDAARPLICPKIIKNTFSFAKEHGSAVCAVPVKFALRKKIGGSSKSVDRSEYYEVQTPQVFYWKMLWNAYEYLHDSSFFDDASLVEAKGYKIFLVKGDYNNLKITTPTDMIIADVLLKNIR